MRWFSLALMVLAGCDKAAPAVPRPTIAAIAIRDVVPGYQQWGTEKFTVPKLERSYDKHWYFTEEKRGEKHKDFVDALTTATQKYDAVDVWVLAHGNRYIEWVAEIPAADRAKIRLVYNTGGGDSDQGRSWLRLGAQAYVGHPGGNVAPLFYLRFLPLWVEGKPLKDAVDEANKAMKDDLDSSVARLLENVAGNPGDLKKLEVGTDAEIFGNAALKHAGKSGK